MRKTHPDRSMILKRMAIAAITAAVAAIPLFAVTSQQARQDERLQERADAAALAGVNALAAAGDQSQADQTRAAITAARAVTSDSRMVVKAVLSKPAAMSVEVILDDVVKGANVRSVARYVPPGDAIAPHKSSGLGTGAAGRTPL